MNVVSSISLIYSDMFKDFYVLLTVHLSISLDNDQLDIHLLYFILQYVYCNPLHVSSIICSSSGGSIVLIWYRRSQSVAFRCTGRPLTESDDTSIQLNLLMMNIKCLKRVEDYNKRIVK